MITLRLKVSYVNGEAGKFMSVTSDMLEVVPSPGGVSHRPCDAGACLMLESAAPAKSIWSEPGAVT